MALVEAISCAASAGSLARMGAVAMAVPQCNTCAGLECREISSRSQVMGVALETWKRSVAFGRARDDSRRGMSVVSRMGGTGGAGASGGAAPPPRPRITMPGRRPAQQQEPSSNDGPFMNQDIRVPQVRLLDEDSNMLGVVPTGEALQRARDADLDLVMISPDADPPVVRIMDYSKYRYEQQKKRREAQKKAAASRQELKELKMRYNIDTHDYNVRLRQAQRFLKDGDKVKVVCQFKGRELDFKDLAVKLFEKFQEEIGEAAMVEQKITFEGKTMIMVLTPNKATAQKEKAAAQAQSAASKAKIQGAEKAASPASVENAVDDSSLFTPGNLDLLVVGPGVLGSLVAQQWFQVNEGEFNVVGQTNTTNRHEELRSLGIIPVVKDDIKAEKFSYVIFCAGSADYAAEVKSDSYWAAVERWNGEGCLLFTSSSALYSVSDNGICDEETAPVIPRGAGPRTDRLHGAEEEVLKVGGCSTGWTLYTLERGAHSYYLSQGTIAQRPDHIVNLIHYEDAASLCVAILKGEHRGRIFLGCDNHPVSRQEIMDAVNKSGKYEKKLEEFTSVDGPLGKRMNNDPTRRATDWKPKYESFPSFLGVTS